MIENMNAIEKQQLLAVFKKLGISIIPNVRTFYQKKTVNIAAQNTEYPFSFSSLKNWDRVVRVIIYTDTDYTSNHNVEFSKPFKIDNIEFFCETFDTGNLQARLEFEEFTRVWATADGSEVEGTLKDPNEVAAAYDVNILLVLESDIKEGE